MDDLLIQYHGFSPSPFIKDHVQCLMQQIQDESPASSALRISITKSGERTFKGSVQISSHVGQFYVQTTSSSLIDIADRLLERARRKLEKWKDRRFRVGGLKRQKYVSETDSFSLEDRASFRGSYEIRNSQAR